MNETSWASEHLNGALNQLGRFEWAGGWRDATRQAVALCRLAKRLFSSDSRNERSQSSLCRATTTTTTRRALHHKLERLLCARAVNRMARICEARPFERTVNLSSAVARDESRVQQQRQLNAQRKPTYSLFQNLAKF